MNSLWMLMVIEVGVLVAGAYGLAAWVQGSANVLRWTVQSPYPAPGRRRAPRLSRPATGGRRQSCLRDLSVVPPHR